MAFANGQIDAVFPNAEPSFTPALQLVSSQSARLILRKIKSAIRRQRLCTIRTAAVANRDMAKIFVYQAFWKNVFALRMAKKGLGRFPFTNNQS
jgi:hypothetical protein